MLNDIRWHKRADVCNARRALNVSEVEMFLRAKREADGLAVWSAWKPGTATTPRGSANLLIDVPAMLAVDFEVSTE